MKNVTISTRKRLFSDDSMMALSMDGLRSIFLGLILKDELRLELIGAAGDHDIALLQSRLDDDAVAGVAAGLDGQERERTLVRRGRPAGLGGNKDPALALDLDHAGMGNRQGLLRGRAVQED